MLPMYREKCKVMYTDTDSLIYLMECDDVYDIMKRDISRFDTSNYAVDNAYGIPLANKKYRVWWRMKIMIRSWSNLSGLKQMYALRVDGKEDTKKVKVVKSNVIYQVDNIRRLHAMSVWRNRNDAKAIV